MSWEVGGWLAGLLNTAANDIISKLNTVNNKVTTGGVPIVRHIQRGTVKIGTSYEEESGITVTLSGFTNINKMIVILDGVGSRNGSSYDSSYAIVHGPYLYKLSTTSMDVRTTNSVEGDTISYQVIELW